jgi:hypothetical protein
VKKKLETVLLVMKTDQTHQNVNVANTTMKKDLNVNPVQIDVMIVPLQPHVLIVKVTESMPQNVNVQKDTMTVEKPAVHYVASDVIPVQLKIPVLLVLP